MCLQERWCQPPNLKNWKFLRVAPLRWCLLIAACAFVLIPCSDHKVLFLTTIFSYSAFFAKSMIWVSKLQNRDFSMLALGNPQRGMGTRVQAHPINSSMKATLSTKRFVNMTTFFQCLISGYPKSKIPNFPIGAISNQKSSILLRYWLGKWHLPKTGS